MKNAKNNEKAAACYNERIATLHEAIAELQKQVASLPQDATDRTNWGDVGSLDSIVAHAADLQDRIDSYAACYRTDEAC